MNDGRLPLIDKSQESKHLALYFLAYIRRLLPLALCHVGNSWNWTVCGVGSMNLMHHLSPMYAQNETNKKTLQG